MMGRDVAARLVGEPFPEVELIDEHGEPWSIQHDRGTWVVIFLYPKDDSFGCTIEARAFEKHMDEFLANGAKVIGVSTDDMSSHARFKEHCEISFPLLSDARGRLRKALDLPWTFGILPPRATFLVDPDGIIRHGYCRQFTFRRHVSLALKALERAVGR